MSYLKNLACAQLLLAAAVHGLPSKAEEHDWPPPVQALSAQETVRLAAPEAKQGVAVDEDYYYAVGNQVIAAYSRSTLEREFLWRGASAGPIIHLNACLVDGDELACAHSNYPGVPFANSIEWYRRGSLQPSRSRSLGVMDEGSLVWMDRVPEGWIAGLAHYDGKGGLSFKDHSFSTVELYDPDWRRLGGWALPESVVERIAPKAASGGAIGPDGYLYLMGHDRPEMYVLGKPLAGPSLVHIATIAIDAEGQAFDFDESDPGALCAISRPNREIRCFRVPQVQDNPAAYEAFLR